MTSMIETVRARLTLWHVSVLAAALLLVGGLIYVLLARALYARIDDNLDAVVHVAMTSLTNDLAEGQDEADAAQKHSRRTVLEPAHAGDLRSIAGACLRKTAATATCGSSCRRSRPFPTMT